MKKNYRPGRGPYASLNVTFRPGCNVVGAEMLDLPGLPTGVAGGLC